MYINQKHSRDCLQATLANLLNIDYDNIPAFYERCSDGDNYDFIEYYENWLHEQGYFRVLFDIEIKDGAINMPAYWCLNKIKCIGILAKKDRDHTHAVLLEIEKANKKNRFNIYLLHDPKVNSDYDIDDLIGVEFVFKLNEL